MTDKPFVHPDGRCESDDVGDGTRVWAFAHVMEGAKVGAHCNIGEGAFLETGAKIGNHVTVKNNVSVWDGVRVEDYAFLGPACVFTNDFLPRSHPDFKTPVDKFRPTVVSEGASIGANATIICGNTVGAWAMVGAGSVVTRDVKAHSLVVGNPAKHAGWVCKCGARLDQNLVCPECSRVYVNQENLGLREKS